MEYYGTQLSLDFWAENEPNVAPLIRPYFDVSLRSSIKMENDAPQKRQKCTLLTLAKQIEGAHLLKGRVQGSFVMCKYSMLSLLRS